MSTATIPQLTVKEAAQQLRVSAALVYSLCAAKKIRCERHGLGRGTISIPAEALDEYRKRCTVEAGEPVPGLKHLTLSPS